MDAFAGTVKFCYEQTMLMNALKDGISVEQKTLDPLTVREQEVLQLILSGKSNREIAEDLLISENTVKTHARSIYSKYDVSSQAELIRMKNQTGG